MPHYVKMDDDPKEGGKLPILHQALAFVLLVSINLIVPFAMSKIIDIDYTWYGKLIKPDFTPPDWFFGQYLWSCLYITIAFAAWHLYINNKFTGHRVAAYICQAFFNFIWTPIFFGGEQIFLAFLDTILQLISVLWAAVGFVQVDQIAGACLLPYLMWVSFATYFNGSLWYLNHHTGNQTLSGLEM